MTNKGNSKKELKERLAEAMTRESLKVSDLADLTGIHVSTLSQYLNGRMEPKQDKLSTLAEALKVQETWLLGYDVPMIPFEEVKGIEAEILQNVKILNIKGKEEVLKRVKEMSFVPFYR